MNGLSSSVHTDLSASIERIGGIFQDVLNENAVLWSMLKCVMLAKYLPQFKGTIIDAELFLVKSYLITHGFVMSSGELSVDYFLKHYPLAGHGAPGNLMIYRGNEYHDGRSICVSLIGPYVLGCRPLPIGKCITAADINDGYHMQLMTVQEFSVIIGHLKPISM